MSRTLMSAPPTGRVGRYPKHTFALQELPFTAQPFMFARVLPGETLENIYFETRVITDPIVSPITVWKKEYHFFYVRITDLLNDTIRDMFIDPANTDLTATLGIAANDQAYYTAKGGIDYLKRSTQRIWEHYYADQGDVFANRLVAGYDASSNGLPFVQIQDRFWLDSITDKDDMPVGGNPSTTSTLADLEALETAFEQLRAMGIANQTYEDFLRSYGIGIPNKDEGKPELLAKFSDVQYPSNTIDPSSGAPTSAVSWVFKNSARKNWFFKEPGFIVGLTVTRPKIYFAGLAGMLAAHAGRAWDWMPNYLMEAAATPHPETALKKFAADTGPLGDRTTATDAYWVDMRDELLYGDQFVNRVAFNATPANVPAIHGLALPPGDNASDHKYPSVAMAKSFFVDTAGTNQKIRQDGFASLTIKGKQVDYTVGNLATA